MIDLTAIINQINEQVDGQALARLLNYHVDKIQISGNSLKCFCPVHNERAFRSLIFDLKNKSFKCMMKHCSCFDGGNFVEFWAIYKHLEPINAARDLADKLKLAIDLSTLRQLGESFAEEARTALETGDLTLAREKTDEALALDPRNGELRQLSARIWHELGENDRALAERLALCNDLLAAGELEPLFQLIEELERLHGRTTATVQERLRWARATGDLEAIIEALRLTADMHGAAGELEAALDALNEASLLDDSDSDLLAQLADLQARAGRETDLRDTLQRWAASVERRGEQHTLLTVLERLALLDPHDVTLGERIALLQAELGSPEQARELWLQLATTHTSAGRYGEAITIFEKLIAANPDRVDLRERRARLLGQAGRGPEAIAAWRELAGLAREVGANERVNEYYELARAIDPSDPKLREDQAAWKLTCGDVEGGLADLFALAELFLETGDTEPGMAVLERIASLAPTSLDKRLRVGRCLERNRMFAEAFASYAQLVRDLLAQQQHDAALAICEELKRLQPLEPRTLELRIETHLALKQKPEAIEVCRDAARAWLAGDAPDRTEQAEAALQRGIKLDRAETRAKTDLARLYETTERATLAGQLWLEMALFHRAQAQPQAANEAIREALRLDPANREAKQMLAEGLETAGALADALALWRELVADLLEAGSAHHRAALGLIVHALELAPRDQSLLEQAVRLTLDLDGAEPAQTLVTRWLHTFDGVGDVPAALDAWRLAVRHYPAETPWRARLAAMLLARGETDEAAEHFELLLGLYREQGVPAAQQVTILEQLVALRPDRTDLRAEQAQLMAAQGNKREAAHLYQELAEAALTHGNLEAGLEYYRQASGADPDHVGLLSRLAELMERAGRIPEALPLYEHLAELRRRETDRQGAAAVLEKLLSYDGSRADLRAELAEIYELEGDVDRAVEHNYKIAQGCAGDPTQSTRLVTLCRKVRSLAPEFIPARELLIEGLLRLQASEEAKRELDALGDLALNDNQLERAESYFKRVLEIDPDDIGSGERLGKLYEARGRHDEAAHAFEHVLNLYEQMSETARAISVLQKLKHLRPGDLVLRRRLAHALLNGAGSRHEAGTEWLDLIRVAIEASDADAMLEALDEAGRQFKSDWAWRANLPRMLADCGEKRMAVEAWQALATDALEAREFEQAREAAGEGLRLDGNADTLRELRIDANRRLSNYDSAAEDLRELAVSAAARGQAAQAKKYLLHALELQPRALELLDMLAEMDITLGETSGATATLRRLCEHYRQASQWEPALARARRINELNPENPEWQDYLATLLLEAGRTDEAIELWRVMAGEAVAAGRPEQAIARYSRILEYLPGNIETLRHLADLTYETGGMHAAMGQYDRLIDALYGESDTDAIEAEFRRILDLEPGHLQLKERYADFLREHGRADEARNAFLEIVAAYRDDREEFNDAVRVLRRVKLLEPENLGVREEEARLLEKLDRREEAAQVWHGLAEQLRRAGRGPAAAQAITQYAELLAEDVDAQREAADFFEEYDEPEKATQYYLRAIAILDTNDQLEPCVSILERAIRLNPMRLDLPDALARLLERLGQMQRAQREWLALATQYEERNQPAQALQVYKHLRALLPAERESRRRLVRLYEVDGNRAALLGELRELAKLATTQDASEEAAEYWQKLLTFEPQDEAALLALAELWRALDRSDALFETLGTLGRAYCAAGRHAEALANLEAMRALRPEEPELLGQSIELLIQTGRLDQAAQQGIDLIQIYFARQDDHHALETLHRIAEIEPANIERRISLARLVHANGREADALQEFFLSATKLFGEAECEGALSVCEAGLQLFSDDVRLRDLMGRALQKLGRLAEAIEVQLHLAALYDERGEEGKAQRVYESILADQPDHLGTLDAMVDWAVRHGKVSVAVENLVSLAEAYYLAGNLPDAIVAMERVRSLDATRLDLRARLAEVYWETGNADTARETWLETGNAFLNSGQPDAAIELFERLRGLDPDHLEALDGLAHAFAATGRTEQHKTEALALAEKYHAAGRSDDALELLETLTELYPTEPQPWHLLSALYAERRVVVPAVRAYQRLAQVHQAARRLEPARTALLAAFELQPENIELIEQLGELALQLGRRPEGLEHLGRTARLLMEQGEWERARAIAERVLKLDPLSLATRQMLGEALELMGERAEAIKEYTEAARGYAEAHQNAPALTILQRVLTLESHRNEERELYARLLHREGRHEESIEQYLLLLDTLGENDDPRRTIKYCRLILAEQPDHPDAHRHLCAIYERTDKLRQAFKECEWLADHYQKMGALHEAETFLRKGLAWFPDEAAPRTRLIELLETMGQTLAAAQQLNELAQQAEARHDAVLTLWALEKACSLEPTNLEHPRRLADYYDRQGDAPAARVVRLRLTRQLLDNGAMEEARTLAERLADSGDDAALRLELAEMFQAAGLPEVAAFHYHIMARNAREASQYEDCKTWARQALTLKPRHVGAREMLIEALRAQGENNAAVHEYQVLVDLYQSAGEFEQALITLQALVDLTPSEPEPRQRLIELYRRMRRDEAMVEQLRRLGEIYVNRGDYAQAATCLRELMQERPDDTVARVRFIDIYTQLGDETELKDDYLQLARIFARKGAVVEATRTYEKLIAAHPDDLSCRELFVQFLFEQGQVNRAVEETRVLADKLEAAERFQETGRALDRALNFAPEELDLRQRLAGIYLRTNRRGLALETFRSLARIYEQHNSEDRLLEVFEQIVAIDGLNVEFRQRLADLLQRRGQHDHACEHLRKLATMYLERGMHDLAEHEFRRILEMHPEEVTLWEQVIDIHLQIGSPDEVVPDLMMVSDLYLNQGRMKDAMHAYKRILESEPDNLDILRRYIDVYQQIGFEEDLVDDYLRLADLRVQRGEVGEAIRIFKHLMEVRPDDPAIRERLTQTQRLSQLGGAAPAGPAETMSGTSLRRIENLKQAELMKVIRNYQNVLKLNPNNPTARVKLAELFEHAGDFSRADEHWSLASESYLGKGDLLRCIEICERYLLRHPEDATVRERLTKARVQHDSMRAIDGAISKELGSF